jgi:hypothetical protein
MTSVPSVGLIPQTVGAIDSGFCPLESAVMERKSPGVWGTYTGQQTVDSAKCSSIFSLTGKTGIVLLDYCQSRVARVTSAFVAGMGLAGPWRRRRVNSLSVMREAADGHARLLSLGGAKPSMAITHDLAVVPSSVPTEASMGCTGALIKGRADDENALSRHNRPYRQEKARNLSEDMSVDGSLTSMPASSSWSSPPTRAEGTMGGIFF